MKYVFQIFLILPSNSYILLTEEDDEAFAIWRDEIGIAEDRIFKFNKEDNFWEHGAGPCGPCSEVYYDRGEKYSCGKPDCTVGCDCDRYIEVWNNVFTQFEGDGKGNYVTLDQKNIDTGMGLERLATAVQDVESIFDVDTIRAIREHVSKISGKEYKVKHEWDVSIRIITDHIRSATFMISDGIIPSNEGRGYVLRRLIRRACRHAKLLGINEEFLIPLAESVIKSSKVGYPELEDKKSMIFNVLKEEESKFNKTIDTGLQKLNELCEKIEKNKKDTVRGKDAFMLYDTYGFPLELTIEIVEEKGYKVDIDGFNEAMEVQRETARQARKETNYMGADATVYEKLDTSLKSTFVGYELLENESKITALTSETDVVYELNEGDVGTIIVEETPFYATMGGQKGDMGTITTEKGEFEVTEAIKLPGDKAGHVGKVVSGTVKVGDFAKLKVDAINRNSTAKNHSATHLLQKALKLILGDHVEQAGSYVDGNRLRFDFNHYQAMTPEEISKVENIVNEQIVRGLNVITSEMSMEEAKETGATALFGEKYGKTVRVVAMGDFSIELCGGTHVSNTNIISSFKIVSETGIASGVRRIEALTSTGLMDYYKDLENTLNEAAKEAKTTTNDLVAKIASMNEEIKTVESENEKLKAKMASDSLGDAMSDVMEVSGIKLLAKKLDNIDMNELRNLSDSLKEEIGEGVVVLVSSMDDKANMVVTATDAAIDAGAHAGNMIKELASLIGGGGGGRPNMAQAGGKNPAGADDVVAKAAEVLESQIK